MMQPQTRGEVLAGVNQHGVAPGARKMIDSEEEAAQHAIDTGIYAVYRNSTGQDCTRVGPSCKCFCGHLLSEHAFVSRKSVYPRCTSCACQAYQFVPRRPEEVGDWWLVRRKGFNVHTWRAKCRCGHGHDEHDPVHKRCRCGCARFTSNFACLACDKLWEDHETLFESAQERMAAGRPVGEAFRPLAGDQAIREAVFPGEHQAGAAAHARATAASCQPNRLRPAQVPRSQAEKSVQIMHESSGGAIKGQDVANRYGRVPAPPKEWLFMGGSPEYNEAEALEAAQAQYQAQMDGRAGRTAGVAPATLPARAKSPQRLGIRAGAASAAESPSARVSRDPAAVRRNAVGPAGRSVATTAAPRPTSSAAGTMSATPTSMSSGFRPVYD